MLSGRHILPVFAVLLLLGCGCSSIIDAHKQKEKLMAGYMAGNAEYTATMIAEKVESARDSGDEVMWQLESGSMHFYGRRYAEALQAFERAEARMAEYDRRAVISARDVGAEAGATLTNLNALPYRGWNRDRIMLPFYKSLAYLGQGNTEGFRVEAKRLREAQERVAAEFQSTLDAEAAEVEAQNARTRKTLSGVSNSYGAGNVSAEALQKDPQLADPLARTEMAARSGYGGFLNPVAIYLSGFSFARDGDWENALIDFQRLFEIRPNHPLWPRYYVTALKHAGRAIPEEVREVAPFEEPLGRDTVVVIIGNGRGPAFRQMVIHLVLPYVGYTGFAFPLCEYYPAAVSQFQITAGGKTYRPEVAADMDGILSQEYTERLPGMIMRTAVSYLAKEAAALAATQLAKQSDNDWAVLLAYLGTGVYKYLFNTADTRTWELLPKEFRVAQLPMPENRRLTIAAPGLANALEIPLPRDANTAIVYVNIPAAAAVTWQVLPLK